VIPIPNPSQPTVQASQPAKLAVPIGAPVEKHRGRKKGEPRPPSRPMDIIYSDKLNAAFRSASLLVRRLKSLSRDKYVKESDMAREKYQKLLATIQTKVAACQPTGQTEEETLSDWTG